MSSDYGYINARIRAMKSFLLKQEDYSTALRQKTSQDFISFLGSLPAYANDMRQVLTNFPEESVSDEALKLNLCRTFRKILRFCEGEPKKLVTILLKPWDIYNLKTIIRGILGSKDKAEVSRAFVPAGTFDLDFLKHLIETKDLKVLADNLAISSDSDLEKEFAKLLKDYKEDSSLELLESSFMECYFKNAGEYLIGRNGNAHIVLDYLSFKTDALNILLVLQKIAFPDMVSNFIQGGRLRREFLKDLMPLKSIEDALKVFVNSSFPWLASEGLDLYRRTQRLSSVERLLKNKLFYFCQEFYTRGDPLSISIPLAFINFKENEVNNLRLINKAAFFKVPRDLVKEELIFAG